MNEFDESKLTYEIAIKRLEEIVSLLEEDNASLENSLKLFEEGTKLTAYCSRLLNEAEQRITVLTKEN